MSSWPARINLWGTAVFVVALAVATPTRGSTFGQWLIATVSMVLFAVGVVGALWAYATALDRSRAHEIGVANLYLLTGTTAPADVKLWMNGALAVQVVAAVTGAIIGVQGLRGDDLNMLAFGVLVPMLGIGMNGAWAARYGSYGPRLDPVPKPSNRRIE